MSVADPLQEACIALLGDLVSIPSHSRQEQNTADLLQRFLQAHDVSPQRHLHNVWATSKHHDVAKPTVLLNSHHDTVPPGEGWTHPPYGATIADGRLYGLGSNDAGASLVCLLAAFLTLHRRPDLPFNLVLAATAEEEISGANGIEALLPLLGPLHMAVVGEPTGMRMAIAEKGLLVLDCTAHGTAGHAARGRGDNAIYRALPCIQWFRDHRFARVSPWLGEVHMNVTVVHAGKLHNVLPDRCDFTVDVRLNECYTHQEILDEIRAHVDCSVVPRSMRLAPSHIAQDHPLVLAGKAIGVELFGSPTLSDQALLTIPSIKIGPGSSERSHTADEFIYLSEVHEGMRRYCALLEHLRP
jgi:acetylornithine deacetylase